MYPKHRFVEVGPITAFSLIEVFFYLFVIVEHDVGVIPVAWNFAIGVLIVWVVDDGIVFSIAVVEKDTSEDEEHYDDIIEISATYEFHSLKGEKEYKGKSPKYILSR